MGMVSVRNGKNIMMMPMMMMVVVALNPRPMAGVRLHHFHTTGLPVPAVLAPSFPGPSKSFHGRSAVSLFLSENHEPQQQQQKQQQAHHRAVGDVVQGLHGGKYQFSDVTTFPSSYEGHQFAQNGYGATTLESSEYNVCGNHEPLPNWAKRLLELPLPNQSPELDVLASDQTIHIQNDERTWETYYAFVIGPLSATIVVEPNVGQLAPRGGVHPFSDAAQLTVTNLVDRAERATTEVTLSPPKPDTSTGANMVGGESYLVVGTEAERWFYRLTVVTA
jgi:hypothetical protein